MAFFTLLPVILALSILGMQPALAGEPHSCPIVHPHQGLMDLKGWDFSQMGNVALNGEWAFYDEGLLPPDTLRYSNRYTPHYVQVPNHWGRYHIDDRKMPRKGTATYRLRVYNFAPRSLLAIEVDKIYSCYILWVNNEQIASSGVLAGQATATESNWSPQRAVIEVESDTLDIVIQTANFHYRRGGIVAPIYLGTPESISHHWESKTAVSAMSIGSLVFFGLFFLAIYLMRRQQPANLFFAIFCALWASRVCFSGMYLSVFIFPELDWQVIARVEHISVFFTLIAGTSFINATFPGIAYKHYINMLMAVNYLCAALVIVLPTYQFSFIIRPYQVFLVLNLSYILYIIAKATTDNAKGAWFTATSVAVTILVFWLDIMAQSRLIHANVALINTGYFMVFFLNAMALAYRFEGVKKAGYGL